ncbi:MAG: DUF4783 domain-containing protein [Cryomorphaceae bacterium]
MRYLALITFILFLSFNLCAQDYAVISKAFSDGNATELGRLFDTSVEYSVDGATSNLDRSDAENKMRTFFMDNEPRNFEIVHKGVSKQSDVHYCIAQLSSSGGDYRVMLYLHKSMDTYLIQSIEIEND